MPLSRERLLDGLATAYLQILAAMAGTTIAESWSDHGVIATFTHVVEAEIEGDRRFKVATRPRFSQ
jgi:hypothetical protein